jgi:sulfur carrier protein
MNKKIKIKIRVNGKLLMVNESLSVLDFLKKLKIPIKKVAIELNQEIVDKNILSKVRLKKNDKIEIVHFIGGG